MARILNVPMKFVLHKKLLTFESSSCYASYSSSASLATSGLMVSSAIQSPVPPCDISQPVIVRRSGNYKPTTYDFEFIESLNTKHLAESYSRRASELKVQLRMILENQQERVGQMELIDDLQKLGMSYHFEDEINRFLTRIYEHRHLKNVKALDKQSLYAESLEFRLLRQHGFKVSEEIFDCFKNEKGTFETWHRNDTKGLLQLYEASHLLTEGESTLEQAREFATICLRKYINLSLPDHETDNYFGLMVRSALELPLHWRAERPYARWFIHAYETRPDKNDLVLEFAKLDYNSVQQTYQEELKHVSRWWKEIGLAEKLPFARDSLVESYTWTAGGLSQPQDGYTRIICTKVIALLTVIDDVYDVYGTLEELELFTDVILRWDMEKMHELPEYMQTCFLALNKFITEMSDEVLETRGFLIIPYLKKSWADLCTAYLQEARWYFEGYTPRFEEYMNNAWISVALPAVLGHAYFTSHSVTEEDPQCLNQDIVQWASMIIRLADDLGTSPEEMKRGDVPKTLQCYMNETGADEEEAQEHVKLLTHETWKKINTEQVEELPFPHGFIRSMIDLGRMAQYIYQNGDGYRTHFPFTGDHFRSLLFEHIA